MARVKCSRCGKKMTDAAFTLHAVKCAPAPNPGESFADYKKRISPPAAPPCGADVNLECDCPRCQGL
jgi:hypothetical protein